jgi:hypothetical protein
MANDFIPRADGAFDVWQSDFTGIILTDHVAFGISPGELHLLQIPQTRWNAAWAEANSSTNRTSAEVLAKDEARKDYKTAIRSFVVRFVNGNPLISDADRRRMGLTVHSTSHTPAPVPATAPEGSADFSQHMQHSIHFRNSDATNRAKPVGVHGCEIWRKLGGDAPVNASELTFLAVDTHSPFIINYQGEDVGKTACYWLRWVNTRGETGPWSTSISAMIA